MNRFKSFVLMFVFLLIAANVSANPDQQKIYKEVYGGDKPKCLACHVEKTPKKEEGKHELNDYGKKVQSIQETLDAESYKKAGPIPAE